MSSAGMTCLVPTGAETFDLSHLAHPAVVQWKAADPLRLDHDDATSYFYVAAGAVGLRVDTADLTLGPGWFGSVVGRAEVIGTGRALVATRLGYRGMHQVGGPIEAIGRLRYIDGCSSTLLLSALKVGDPCFNFLYVPPGVDQTPHTHPTLRAGYVVSGHGTVIVNGGTLPLRAGTVFLLMPDVVHSFHTKYADLRIVIFHPDSDFGPSDQVHPMLNRTVIDGQSATDLRRLDRV